MRHIDSSCGSGGADGVQTVKKRSPNDMVIALAGNPNVGKSTVFNGLTGMKQHTGNWAGKTVENAQGYCKTANGSFVMVDIPGTYSLMAHSAEEEVARNFICFGDPDAVVVVCDATCLERNLNLVLQTMETSRRVIVCVNLMDEAARKHISIDIDMISQRLGVPVVGITARKKGEPAALCRILDKMIAGELEFCPLRVQYPEALSDASDVLAKALEAQDCGGLEVRWLSLKLLDADEALLCEINRYLGHDILALPGVRDALVKARAALETRGIDADKLKDMTVSALVAAAENVCRGAITHEKKNYDAADRRIDGILTGKLAGFPIMLCLLAVVFYLTVVGANYPSQVIASALFWLQDRLSELFITLRAPEWLHGALVQGVYRVLAWVVSVMLPPMAIFFPLFTLLEDAGYLPRVAYNLDKPFKRCRACGKQALTMWVVDNGMRRIWERRPEGGGESRETCGGKSQY